MNKRTYLITLYAASIFGAIAVLPFALSLHNKSLSEITALKWVLYIAQNLVTYAIAVGLGFFFSNKLNINFVLLENNCQYVKKYFISNAKYIIGIVLLNFAAICGLDLFIFKDSVSLGNIEINPVYGFLASFYGGINEEILNRFFLTSLIAFILNKIFKVKATAMWSSIIITSIVFGLLHLPATAAITPLTFKIVLRAIVLNGIPGITFGILYWKKSLEFAMVTHFFVDICLYVLFPILKHVFSL